MSHEHHYQLTAVWGGNQGKGTDNVRTYDRSHTITISNKPVLHLTTDNAAVGDPNKHNPEDLLVSAIASCHMLSYLYLCAMNKVVVMEYVDHATGLMIEQLKGGGQFKEVVLKPEVIVADASMIDKAIELHHEAHKICYIASSVNFEVLCQPVCHAKS